MNFVTTSNLKHSLFQFSSFLFSLSTISAFVFTAPFGSFSHIFSQIYMIMIEAWFSTFEEDPYDLIYDLVEFFFVEVQSASL